MGVSPWPAFHWQSQEEEEEHGGLRRKAKRMAMGESSRLSPCKSYFTLTRATLRGVPSHKSQSHWRSIRAISAVESMKVGTYHFTWVPCLKSQV